MNKERIKNAILAPVNAALDEAQRLPLFERRSLHRDIIDVLAEVEVGVREVERSAFDQGLESVLNQLETSLNFAVAQVEANV